MPLAQWCQSRLSPPLGVSQYTMDMYFDAAVRTRIVVVEWVARLGEDGEHGRKGEGTKALRQRPGSLQRSLQRSLQNTEYIFNHL